MPNSTFIAMNMKAAGRTIKAPAIYCVHQDAPQELYISWMHRDGTSESGNLAADIQACTQQISSLRQAGNTVIVA